jgi:pimeloyl-ACP methyl ester carboxylesterase
MKDALLRTFLYPAPVFPVPAPPEGMEEVWLTLPDGGQVHGWLDQAPDAERAVVVLHGNGENLATMAMAGIFHQMRALKVRSLAVDYPGYGRSEGQPSEAGNIAAAVAAVEELGRRSPDLPVGVWGWSLGAAVGIQAAKRCQPLLADVTLLSAWATLEAIARQHFPAWLVKPLLSESYDSVAAARGLDLPALVIHGMEDALIPAGHGEQLSKALPGLHRWVPVAGAGHNDLLGFPEVWRAMAGFWEGMSR